MPTRFESVKRIGRKIATDDDKVAVVAIALALIVVASVVAGYYVVLKPQAEPYSTVYVLDAQKNTADYPQTLVANQNSTFSIYVDVANHLGKTANYQVKVKMAQNLGLLPIEVDPTQIIYINNLASGQTSENTATITQNELGSYYVVFELWQDNDGAPTFTNNYCTLTIQVIK